MRLTARIGISSAKGGSDPHEKADIYSGLDSAGVGRLRQGSGGHAGGRGGSIAEA